MPLNLLRNVLLQAAGTTPRRTALPVDEEDLLRTPDYNPQPQPAPMAHPQAPEQGSYGDRQLRPVVSGISEILSDSLEGRTQEIYDEYRQQIENKPQPSGWRTAAAIGTSFIRPLREGGVPGMLMNSPEQQQWAQRTSILGQQLDAANKQRLEEIKQRGDAAKAFAQYGSDARKPVANTKWVVMPDGTVHSILSGGEMQTKNGEQTIYNPEPYILDPGQMRGRGGESPVYGTPDVVDGNVIGGGNAPTLAPSAKQESEDTRYTEDTKAGADRDVARTNAGASNYRADRNYAAITDAAKTRGIYGVQEAAVRGSLSGQGRGLSPDALAKAAASSRDAFQRSAVSLSRSLKDFDAVRTPEDLQNVVDELSNNYDSQALTLRSLGIPVPDESFIDLFNNAITEHSGIFSGLGIGAPGVDPNEAQRALNMAIQQGIQNLSIQAPAAPATTSDGVTDTTATPDGISDADLQETYDAYVASGVDPEQIKQAMQEQYGRLPASLSAAPAPTSAPAPTLGPPTSPPSSSMEENSPEMTDLKIALYQQYVSQGMNHRQALAAVDRAVTRLVGRTSAVDDVTNYAASGR